MRFSTFIYDYLKENSLLSVPKWGFIIIVLKSYKVRNVPSNIWPSDGIKWSRYKANWDEPPHSFWVWLLTIALWKWDKTMKLAFSNIKYSQPSGLHCIWQRNETNYHCCCFFVYFSPHRRVFFLTVSGCGGAAVPCSAPCWTKMSWRCLLRTGSVWCGQSDLASSVIHNHILHCSNCYHWYSLFFSLCMKCCSGISNFFCSTFLKRSKNQHLYIYTNVYIV